MKGELFDKWKQFGRGPSGTSQPEEKKVQPASQYVPPAPQQTVVQAPVPTGPSYSAAYIEAAKKASSQTTNISPKRVTGTEEMKMIMENKTSLASAAQVAQPKKPNSTEEMKQTMQNRPAYPPSQPAQVTGQKSKTMTELEQTFKTKVSNAPVQQAYTAPKRKTAYEEMLETMKAAQSAQASKQQEKPKEFIEMPSSAINPPNAAAPYAAPATNVEIPIIAVPEKIIAGEIEQDAELNQIKKSLEDKIKFSQGETLEIKKKPEPEPMQPPAYEPPPQPENPQPEALPPQVENSQPPPSQPDIVNEAPASQSIPAEVPPEENKDIIPQQEPVQVIGEAPIASVEPPQMSVEPPQVIEQPPVEPPQVPEVPPAETSQVPEKPPEGPPQMPEQPPVEYNQIPEQPPVEPPQMPEQPPIEPTQVFEQPPPQASIDVDGQIEKREDGQ